MMKRPSRTHSYHYTLSITCFALGVWIGVWVQVGKDSEQERPQPPQPTHTTLSCSYGKNPFTAAVQFPESLSIT